MPSSQGKGARLQGEMVPMEIEEPSIDHKPQNPSTRRVALLLCLILLPMAFSLAGITLTFPAAEIAYEIEAATPSETIGTGNARDSGLSREESRGIGAQAALLTTPQPDVHTGNGATKVEATNARSGQPEPTPSVQGDATLAASAAVVAVPEPEPGPAWEPQQEPARPVPEPPQVGSPQPTAVREPAKAREPGCSHPPALRAHAAWTKENRAAAKHCLANKTIYFLGNSVTRHWAFTLADILAEGQSAPMKMPPVMYEQQKQKCGRGGKWKGRRPDGGSVVPGADGQCWGLCECSFESVQHADVLGSDASLVFGWIWDIAHPDVETSIREGIGESGPPDIVVYNAGMPEATCPPCHAGLAEAETVRPTSIS